MVTRSASAKSASGAWVALKAAAYRAEHAERLGKKSRT
jgi:hypothetical protein